MKNPANDALARKKTGTTEVGIQRHTPLTGAVVRSDYASMRRLMFSGADPNRFDDYRMTPLLWAIVRGDVDAVRLLWERGADPNVKSNPSDSFGARKTISACTRLLHSSSLTGTLPVGSSC
jgi:ankyrin repeat protein